MNSAAMGPLNADPLSAASVGTALVLGLLARRRGAPGQAMLMSMLSTMAHALSEEMVEYDGRARSGAPDARALRALGAVPPLPRVRRLGVPRRARRRRLGRARRRARARRRSRVTTTRRSPPSLERGSRRVPADAWERGAHRARRRVRRGVDRAARRHPVQRPRRSRWASSSRRRTPRSATTRAARPWSRSRDRVALPARRRCAAQHTDAVLAELGYSHGPHRRVPRRGCRRLGRRDRSTRER